MNDREAMQKAFEIIGVLKPDNFVHRELQGEAWDALRQALAQPEQEPVAIHCPSCLHSFSIVPVAKREWVGLTDDEKESVYKHADAENHQLSKVVSAVEWLLKNKNTT